MKSPFKAIRIKGKGEKAKYMFESHDITEIGKQAQKDIKETRPQIKFEWEESFHSVDGTFFTSAFKIRDMEFQIALFRIAPHHPLHWSIYNEVGKIIYSEASSTFDFNEAKRIIEKHQWKILWVIENYLIKKTPPPELAEYVANFIRKNQSKTKKGK